MPPWRFDTGICTATYQINPAICFRKFRNSSNRPARKKRFSCMTYRDRNDAGQHLAAALCDSVPQWAESPIVVFGLVRGGLPVAEPVARALHAPLDAFVCRKLGAPFMPEFGIGAIAEGGHFIVSAEAAHTVGCTADQLEVIRQQETEEMQRRILLYRGGHDHLPVTGNTVILVDDGLATGVTARAALQALRAQGAARLILAVPVGASTTVTDMKDEGTADEIVCLCQPARFRAVGQWYEDFTQTTDEEVLEILARFQNVNEAFRAAAAAPSGSDAKAAAMLAGTAPPSRAEGTPLEEIAAGVATPNPTAGPDAGTGDPTDTTATPKRGVTKAAAADIPPAGAADTPADDHPGIPEAGIPPAVVGADITEVGFEPPSIAAVTTPETAAAAAPPPAAEQRPSMAVTTDEEVVITDALSVPGIQLHGTLNVPAGAKGLVVFAHGSGSSRHSPRNRQVAETLNKAGFGTLLFDLLSPSEANTRSNVFNIPLLASRLQMAVDWMEVTNKLPATLPLGFFGASTGGGAALWAAAYLGPRASAVVVRGGRPDLAAEKLPAVTAPTLLIVGSDDTQVLDLNEAALQVLGSASASQLVEVPNAGHLFEGPGQLEKVAELAAEWFNRQVVW